MPAAITRPLLLLLLLLLLPHPSSGWTSASSKKGVNIDTPWEENVFTFADASTQNVVVPTWRAVPILSPDGITSVLPAYIFALSTSGSSAACNGAQIVTYPGRASDLDGTVFLDLSGSYGNATWTVQTSSGDDSYWLDISQDGRLLGGDMYTDMAQYIASAPSSPASDFFSFSVHCVGTCLSTCGASVSVYTMWTKATSFIETLPTFWESAQTIDVPQTQQTSGVSTVQAVGIRVTLPFCGGGCYMYVNGDTQNIEVDGFSTVNWPAQTSSAQSRGGAGVNNLMLGGISTMSTSFGSAKVFYIGNSPPSSAILSGAIDESAINGGNAIASGASVGMLLFLTAAAGGSSISSLGFFDTMPSYSPSPTASPSVAATPVASPSVAATPGATPSTAATPHFTYSTSRSPARTVSVSSTPGETSSVTQTIAATPSVTASVAGSPSATKSLQGTPDATLSSTRSPSSSVSVSAATTPTPAASGSLSGSASPSASGTAAVTATPSLSASPTSTPSASSSATGTPAPSASTTHSGSRTVAATFSTTQTPLTQSVTPSSTWSPGFVPSATVTATWSRTPSVSPVAFTLSRSRTHSRSPSLTPSSAPGSLLLVAAQIISFAFANVSYAGVVANRSLVCRLLDAFDADIPTLPSVQYVASFAAFIGAGVDSVRASSGDADYIFDSDLVALGLTCSKGSVFRSATGSVGGGVRRLRRTGAGEGWGAWRRGRERRLGEGGEEEISGELWRRNVDGGESGGSVRPLEADSASHRDQRRKGAGSWGRDDAISDAPALLLGDYGDAESVSKEIDGPAMSRLRALIAPAGGLGDGIVLSFKFEMSAFSGAQYVPLHYFQQRQSGIITRRAPPLLSLNSSSLEGFASISTADILEFYNDTSNPAVLALQQTLRSAPACANAVFLGAASLDAPSRVVTFLPTAAATISPWSPILIIFLVALAVFLIIGICVRLFFTLRGVCGAVATALCCCCYAKASISAQEAPRKTRPSTSVGAEGEEGGAAANAMLPTSSPISSAAGKPVRQPSLTAAAIRNAARPTAAAAREGGFAPIPVLAAASAVAPRSKKKARKRNAPPSAALQAVAIDRLPREVETAGAMAVAATTSSPAQPAGAAPAALPIAPPPESEGSSAPLKYDLPQGVRVLRGAVAVPVASTLSSAAAAIQTVDGGAEEEDVQTLRERLRRKMLEEDD